MDEEVGHELIINAQSYYLRSQITRNQPVYYEAMVGGEEEGGLSDRDCLWTELWWRGGVGAAQL